MRNPRRLPPRRGPGGASVAAILGVLALLTVSSAAPSGRPSAPVHPAVATTLQQFDQHIDHIVFLMQENHAYDNLFGTYCLTVSPYCSVVGNGLPSGTCVPKYPAHPGSGCIRPFDLSVRNLSLGYDLAHTWGSTHTAIAGGKMNGFYAAEGHRVNAFGHYNGTTAPVYWDLAEQYGLADDFFASVASYSDPNHWYMVSDRAPNISYTVQVHPPGANWSQLSRYLNESNNTPAIEDELVNSSVSWAYYEFKPGSYTRAIDPRAPAHAYDYWNALAARAQTYVPSTETHLQNRTSFFQAARNGTLPNISWVIPDTAHSDHPPQNLSLGEDWVSQVVDALELSPEWNRTALFISWDEYGGFYDHVAPPYLDGYGDGIRVPLLAVGPWVPQGVIDHQAMDFDSVLHLMEDRFGLACLGARDCNATLPLGLFNFSGSPRAPLQIFRYGNPNGTYPMPLQSSGALPAYGPRQGAAPVVYGEPSAGPAATVDDPSIDWA